MAGQRHRNTTRKSYWRINQNIQAERVRVIGPDGKQLGIFSVSEALKLASESGLDLVEIAAGASPPVVKIIDFSKFRYQQGKKEREKQIKEKRGLEQKEVWFTPYIGENDYQIRLGKIKGFLTSGNKVRIVVKFKGQQMAHKEFGYELARRVVEALTGLADIDQKPKFLGRQLIMVLTPLRLKSYAGQAPEVKQNEKKV